MKRVISALLILASTAVAQQLSDPSSQVDPLIGTKPTLRNDAGNTVPGAVRPFGLLYWSPDTDDDITPPSANRNRKHFQYDVPVLRGFSLTHLSGEGCGIFGDAPILPMLGVPAADVQSSAAGRRAEYRIADQVAQPGYYAVKLADGIGVRLAADVHSGIAEVVFPKGAARHSIVLNLDRNLNALYDADVTIDGSEVTGSVSGGNFCGGGNRYRVYFVLGFDHVPDRVGTSTNGPWESGKTPASGETVRAFLSYPPNDDKIVIRTAISYVSVANARANLNSEIPIGDFEAVRKGAHDAWLQALNHAQVKGGTPAQRKIFYTALYHALIHPSTFSDVNGEYLGFDGKVHQAIGRVQYANFSGWDIYRDQVQLIAMLFPRIASDIGQSIVADSEEAGRLPKWSVANDESNVMGGDPAAIILADIYAFGARDFDAHAALTAMVRGGTIPDLKFRNHLERPDLRTYLERGYVYYPSDSNHDEEGKSYNGSASVTLEYQSADFAIAEMARALGDREDATRFLARATDWHKSFDPKTGYIRPRTTDGTFPPQFDLASKSGYIEGNAAQYTWMIPYDLQGVIQAIGGPQAANARLDEYFSHYGSDGQPYFNIKNEPSFSDPWIYNWTGRPWRAQEVIHKTLKDLFQPVPDGLPGNDDLGATSAWVVFAQLGFYPAIPGLGGVTMNTPAFPEATLLLGSHRLRVLAPHAGSKPYIAGLTLDGRSVVDWWIAWDELARASTLRFALGRLPGTKMEGAPPSISVAASPR